MEELIIYMIEKRKQLLTYKKKLPIIAKKNKSKHTEQLEKYNEMVEQIQTNIKELKNKLKEKIRKEYNQIKKLSELIEQKYIVELEQTIAELEDVENELEQQKRFASYRTDSIQSMQELIKTLNSRIDVLQDTIECKNRELRKLIPKGKTASSYMTDLLKRIRLIDLLNFKNLKVYMQEFGIKEKEKNSDNQVYYVSNQNLLKCLSMVEQWCKSQFDKNVPKYLRRMPRMSILDNGEFVRCATSEEEETALQKEYSVGVKLNRIKQSSLIKRYETGTGNQDFTEDEIKIIQYYERIKEEYDYADLNIPANNLLEIKQWCENEFTGKPFYMRRRPRDCKSITNVATATMEERKQGLENEKQKEIRLGNALSNFKGHSIYIKYLKGEELSEQEQELVNLYHYILREYDISDEKANLLELLEWCKEKEQSGLGDQIEELLTNGIYSKKIRRTNRNTPDESPMEKRFRLGRALMWFERKSQFSQKYRDIFAKKEMTINESEIPEQDLELLKLYLSVKSYFVNKDLEPIN